MLLTELSVLKGFVKNFFLGQLEYLSDIVFLVVPVDNKDSSGEYLYQLDYFQYYRFYWDEVL